MAELDWVTCKIALAGDVRSIIHRGPHDPVSVPELEVIMALHGSDAVRDPEYLTTTESSAAEEKARLLGKYSERDVSGVYPGRSPNMGMIFADRRGKDIVAPKKQQRPTTRVTAAAPFIPPNAEITSTIEE